jgi:glycine/D-amino acid oxidase-like deaminating enzyme
VKRRTFLHLTAATPLLGIRRQPRPSVAVVGAGAFGGWTALALLRRGCRVTLVDAWGPGHARASSGGETRVIRGVYGDNRLYVELAVRAFELWKEHEKKVGQRLYYQTGALWMVAGSDDSLERGSIPLLREAGLLVQELTPDAAAKRYPLIAFDGIRWALFEAAAGYLLARRACETVLDRFRMEGGTYVQDRATPSPSAGGSMRALTLAAGPAIDADAFVFACGPWLGQAFPELLASKIRPTRQEVFFFGTPPGDRFGEASLPVWIEHGARLLYGIPGNQWRGFKVADDTHGAVVDPTMIETMDRMPSAEGLADARALLARRFPELKGAPIVEARVCQYENSPDSNFIIDRHPSLSNVWIAGGGSGHGFKFGPALGERIAAIVLGERAPDRMFGLARFMGACGPRERGWGPAS